MADASTVMTDDAMLDAPRPESWSTPVEINELSSAQGEDDPSVTDDQLQIFFGSVRPGGMGQEDTWVATRMSSSMPWEPPNPVTELNTSVSETTARVTGDGKTIFFASNRLSSTLDVWFSTRGSPVEVWSSPIRIAELSSGNADVSAAANSALTRLVMVTGASTAAETLYTSERPSTAQAWPAPTRIAELDDSSTSERDPWAPTPFAIYFTRADPIDGTSDIYVSRRTGVDEAYGAPVKLHGANLPTINDRDPWVSADERLLVFASDRSGVSQRLYYSTRLD